MTQGDTMQRFIFLAVLTVLSSASHAQQLDGKLLMYPGGHNLNDMPASAIAAGVPLVLETGDTVATVDAWYQSNAKSCARSAQSGGVKYQCDGGSIMIYDHAGKTQVALVPSLFR
jgi:hypothetical protein